MEDVGPFAAGHVAGTSFLGPLPHPQDVGAEARRVEDPVRYQTGWRVPDGYDRKRPLADLVVLQDDQGPGSTAIIAIVHALFGLLSGTARASFARATEKMRPGPEALVQLDMRVTCIEKGTLREIVLSLWLGDDEPPASWAETLDRDQAWGARDWARIGIRRNGDVAAGTDDLGRAILETIEVNEGKALPLPWIGGTPSGRRYLGLSALPSAVHLTHGPTSVSSGYGPAPVLNLQTYDWFEDRFPNSERLKKVNDFIHRTLGYRGGPKARHWCDDRLRPASDLDFTERAIFSIRLGAILKGTKASIFLIDDFTAELPSNFRWYVHTLLSDMLEHHTNSSAIIKISSRSVAERIHREARRRRLVTSVFVMKAVRAR